MKLIKNITYLLISSLFSVTVYAGEIITVGVSELPPIVIRSENRGIELDIMRAAFAGSNYELEFIYYPIIRSYKEFAKDKLDIVINVDTDTIKSGFISQDVISFRNVVVSLKKHDFDIQKIVDLKDRSIVTFFNAKSVLGDEFSAVVEKNSRYTEHSNQKSSLSMLFLGRTETLIIDEKIFYYWLKVLKADQGHNQAAYNAAYTIAPLFAEVNLPLAFKSDEVREVFDKGLARLRANGEYQKILESYK